METVSITNRSASIASYYLPDKQITRQFEPGETKILPLEEITQLQWVPGGDYMLHNIFRVDDEEVRTMLNLNNVEPEYFYGVEEVKNILKNGTLDQLDDTLTFGPEGVADIIKDEAVKIEIPDTDKRKLITEKTGLNIDNAIMVNKIMNADSGESDSASSKDTAPKRKAATPVTGESTSARKYKVASK